MVMVNCKGKDGDLNKEPDKYICNKSVAFRENSEQQQQQQKCKHTHRIPNEMGRKILKKI